MVRRKNYGRKNTSKNTKPSKTAPMLNVKKENAFRYDLNEILKNSKTDERYIASFIATIISKASRQSVHDARDYVKEKCKEEIIDKDVEKEILRVLNMYIKYR